MCGGISGYNASAPVPGPANLMNTIPMRARMEGFIIFDYMPRAGKAIAGLLKWISNGDLIYQVDLQEGFDNIPNTPPRLSLVKTWANSYYKSPSRSKSTRGCNLKRLKRYKI